MTEISESSQTLSPQKKALLALEKMQSKLDALERARNEPIAMIGVGCRFPGGADSPDAFWQLLCEEEDAIREVPADRWDVDELYDPDPDAPGKVYARHGGFLDDVESFDARFFGISPREALSLDPQQRVLLEVSWEALENAGVAAENLSGTKTGVYVGVMENDYSKLHLRSGGAENLDAYYVTGNHFSFTAGRISYVLGLHGPAMALDTACSSSLVAVHLACQSLRSGESDLALAGGVNLMLSPELTITMCKFRALSPDGRCKTFDESADGFGQGEGCGVVVLKRLSDAVAARDNILAVIRGSAVNHDGPSGGLTVPNGTAQQALLRDALANAGVDPTDVGYVEAHGTGTPLGDPIEVRALGAVYGEGRSFDDRLLIGSVKTNIGHLDSAAGIAGLIKVALALHHEEIPAHLNLDDINPRISLDEIPVEIPTERIPWRQRTTPRLAGVSSFGLSGTNAHIIVEEAPELTPSEPHEDRPLHLLTMSARGETALGELAKRYAHFLSSVPAHELGDVSLTANAGRSRLEDRLAVVADSPSQMSDQLMAYAAGNNPANVMTGHSGDQGSAKISFLFTGQGAQYVGMGRRLYEAEPTFRQTLDRCDEILRPLLEEPLLSVLFTDGESSTLLNETMYTQPALFSLEYALATLWQSWGVQPSVVMGHSVGEYAAACVAGVFSLEDGLALIAERGRLMQSLPRDGSMAVMFASEVEVEAAIRPFEGSLSIAAVNGPRNVVISGERDALQSVLSDAEARDVRVQALKVSHAFHSPLMEPILDAFEQAASTVVFRPPTIPLLSNLTGQLLGPGDSLDAAYWRDHIRRPVQFSAGIGALHTQGCAVFLEIGPNPVLSGMGKLCIPSDAGDVAWIPSLREQRDDCEQMLESLGSMYVHDGDIDWDGFDPASGARRRLVLPTYPFQRERHWLDEIEAPTRSRGSRSEDSSTATINPLLGNRLSSPLPDIQFENHLSSHSPSFMADHRVYGSVLVPGTAFVEMALAAAEAGLGGASYELQDVTIREALVLADDPADTRTVQSILTPDGVGGASFKVLSQSDDEDWTLHATGSIRDCAEGRAPVADDSSLSEARERCSERLDRDDFYATVRAAGLEYGPAFRGITQLGRGPDGEVVGRIELNETLANECGTYGLHPALLDAALQLGLAMTPEAQTADDGVAVFVPVSLGRVAGGSPVAGPMWAHMQVRPAAGSGPGDMIADVLLFGEDEAVVARVEGLHLRRASRASLQRMAQPKLDDWLYEVAWEPADLSVDADRQPDQAGTWLIFDDESEVGSALADRLTARGDSCSLVVPGESFSSTGSAVGHSDPFDPDEFDRWIQGSLDPSRPLRGAVYLGGLAAVDELEAPGLRTTGRALHVLQALERNNVAVDVGLWLITHGSQSVGPAPIPPAVDQAPLWGLGAVIASEHPNRRCVRIDLDPGPGQDDIDLLAQEISAAERETQVAYRNGLRYSARLVRARFEDHGEDGTPLPEGPISTDGTYMVTGGLGGLGLEIAEWLATQGARHLVLIGRSGARGEAVEVVRGLEDSGVQVMVASVDVSECGQMADLLDEIERTMPPLRGIAHAAAVLDDGILLHQNWDRLEKVFAPKVLGAWNLHKLTRHLPLDFFVLFSSWAALVGLPGQGNYVAANAFLDSLAHHRRAEGLPGLSVNWGAWANVGMAAAMDARDQRRLADMGLNAFIPEFGTAAFGRLVEGDRPQVAVLSIDWARYFDYFPNSRQVPLFDHLLEEANARVAVEETNLTKEPGTNQTGPPLTRDLIEERLREMVAQVLRLPATKVAVDVPLADLGLDSLMTTELFADIERTFDRHLPLATLIQAPTIEALSDLLPTEDSEPVSWDSLVEIRPGDARNPIFLVHAEAGNVLLYRDLARHLSESQPVYGLQARGLDGQQIVERSLEEMAADYISEMQTRQPHGPYFIGGWCMGGAIALEMAHQLRGVDEEVEAVVMIQTEHHDFVRASEATDGRRLMYRLVDRLEFESHELSNLPSGTRLRHLGQKIQRISARRMPTGMRSRVGRASDQLLSENAYFLQDLNRSHREAFWNYEPKPYDGRVISIQASRQPRGIPADPTLGWGHLLSGEVDTRSIEAYHLTIMKDPQVQFVARVLDDYLSAR